MALIFSPVYIHFSPLCSGDAKSPAQANFELSEDILARLPDNYDMESVEREFPVRYEESMNTVLRQELIK